MRNVVTTLEKKWCDRAFEFFPPNTKEGEDQILEDYRGQGIENILALRGDPPEKDHEV
ncbi:MAG: methylenetetrahydrofolate reductase [Dehalococcoidia bacterium]|nr:methylenetetrahydrofolate reductase [Dehalococcoidia bacterium]